MTGHQHYTVHFYRNVFARAPKTKRVKVTVLLKVIDAMESHEACKAKALEVADKLERVKLKEPPRAVSEKYNETLIYARFPCEHRWRISTNNSIECLNREIHRHIRVVGNVSQRSFALTLVTTRL